MVEPVMFKVFWLDGMVISFVSICSLALMSKNNFAGCLASLQGTMGILHISQGKEVLDAQLETAIADPFEDVTSSPFKALAVRGVGKQGGAGQE